MDQFSAEDLKDWRKDPRGEPFWSAVKERFGFAISNIRNDVRKADWNKATYDASQADAAEEILQLVDALIQEQKESAPTKEGK